MNREIKFRGKKTQTSEWVYGSLILSTNNQPSCITAIKENPVSNGVLNYWCFGVETNSIGEYTGLNDKNGKEIYEGDLIKCSKSHDYYREVVFSNGNYWLINPDKLMNFEIQVILSSHKESEVIGNIYENPELLKN